MASINLSTANPTDNGRPDDVRAPATAADVAKPPADSLDPFDPARLRLSQDYAATLGVKKLILTVPVRKPSKEWWIQTHPDPAYRIETTVLELKEDRETYLVAPELRHALAGESTFGLRALVTAISSHGVLFLWAIRLPGIDGKLDSWNESALEVARRAAGRWMRISANMALGAYDVRESVADLAEPEWPDVSFRDLLATAFKGRRIDSLDHPVLRRLRGEA